MGTDLEVMVVVDHALFDAQIGRQENTFVAGSGMEIVDLVPVDVGQLEANHGVGDHFGMTVAPLGAGYQLHAVYVCSSYHLIAGTYELNECQRRKGKILVRMW